jgi:hypothetical protein
MVGWILLCDLVTAQAHPACIAWILVSPAPSVVTDHAINNLIIVCNYVQRKAEERFLVDQMTTMHLKGKTAKLAKLKGEGPEHDC